MKRMFAVLVLLVTLCGVCSVSAFATEAPTDTAYVTIADGEGQLVLVQQAINLRDTDADGKITINDALYLAHQAAYEGGAEAGYASYESDYGVSIGRLWGDDCGSYGYYLNNASAWSLLDEVKNGDRLTAFVYTDTATWADQYAYFDVPTVDAIVGDSVTLTLCAQGYDADWNPVSLPVSGAKITVNGADTDYVTDADGKVTLPLEKSGEVVISATSETQILVPPVCVATVENQPLNMPVVVICCAVVFVGCLASVLFLIRRRQNQA